MANFDAKRGPRILHVVDSLGLGGAQTILKCYFESRRAEDHILLFSLRRASSTTEIEHPNVQTYASPSRYSLAPLLELKRLVSGRGVSLLHCHLLRSQVFGWLLKTFFFPDIRLIFHEHGRAVAREVSQQEAWAFRQFLRVAASRVDAFICNSELAREAILKLAPQVAERTVVVSNPIAPPMTSGASDRADARARFGVPNSAFVVGFAARLIKQKGWREFLDAVKIAAREHPMYFLLAGEGRDRAAVRAYVARTELESTGRLLGHMTEMASFYCALDCFVMPSHWEPHGLSHLEAQSYGVPVVISDVPGMKGTVHAEVDSLLCAARDAPGLAHQILRIAQDAELCRRLIENGRMNAGQYTIGAFASALERVYACAGRKDPELPSAHAGESPAPNESKRFPSS